MILKICKKKVTEQCKQMEPSVRALFSICEIEGKIIVSAEIPGVDISERPVFYKGVGRIKGSYVRVGESDEPMSEYEIYSYEAFRKRIRDDIRTISNSKMQLLDEKRMKDYLDAVKNERKNLAENVSSEVIMELMGITADGTPTLAGLMTFSKYPQTYFPQLCITAVALPGTEMGTVGDDGERFIDNKRITGAIPDMLEEAVEFVRKNSRTKTIIDEAGHRNDKAEYPIKAVREAILNALVHSLIIAFIRKMYRYVLKCTVTVWKLRIVVGYMEKFLSMHLEKCIRKREMLYWQIFLSY